ncbi:MAG TPA: aminotransferase class IV [Bacteriovoracaceae bacterium]|nr:aminotransferase class IV [Bacteriovoracaceae bacterium]
MRMINGELRDWDLHFERLRKGIDYLYGPFSNEDNWVALLKNRLEACCQHEEGDKIVRITVYRHQERGLRRTGLISVADLKINCFASPYEAFRTEGKSVRLRTCAAFIKPHWWPAFLKAGSYLDVILAQKLFLKDHDDDLLFLSHDDTILESSVANIFTVRHNKLYTAPLGPNVLEGTMRKKVLEVAHEFFDDLMETQTTLEQAMKGDAVFGSNSVRGLFLVNAIDDHDIAYTKEFKEKFELLRAKVMT